MNFIYNMQWGLCESCRVIHSTLTEQIWPITGDVTPVIKGYYEGRTHKSTNRNRLHQQLSQLAKCDVVVLPCNLTTYLGGAGKRIWVRPMLQPIHTYTHTQSHTITHAHSYIYTLSHLCTQTYTEATNH